ncbi:phage head-tail connector protein [Staphylococcus aureus]|uniref:phage head-tail connector protein n=1 Tax=Staphylococcus aureus TaxID=1280 RepID=UPI000A324144|nr:phage head-tail connector protein [Staphylococcus aureus]
MTTLADVKKRIGLKDEKKDEQLEEIIKSCESQLLSMLPIEVEQIPERFSYMIKEVAVKRYNRIGAEGMTSEAVDGRSNAYELNDFKEYEAIIDNYFNARTRTKKGRAVFF